MADPVGGIVLYCDGKTVGWLWRCFRGVQPLSYIRAQGTSLSFTTGTASNGARLSAGRRAARSCRCRRGTQRENTQPPPGIFCIFWYVPSPLLFCAHLNRSAGCPWRAAGECFYAQKRELYCTTFETMRHRFPSRVRLHREMSSPTFVPLHIFRGLAGVAFLCFGELFWMHMSRIGLEGEGKVLGTTALVLGVTMVIGALCGAAGISVSSGAAVSNNINTSILKLQRVEPSYRNRELLACPGKPPSPALLLLFQQHTSLVVVKHGCVADVLNLCTQRGGPVNHLYVYSSAYRACFISLFLALSVCLSVSHVRVVRCS